MSIAPAFESAVFANPDRRPSHPNHTGSLALLGCGLGYEQEVRHLVDGRAQVELLPGTSNWPA
jgi:hypothetical protein